MIGFLGDLFFSARRPASELSRAIKLSQRLKELIPLVNAQGEKIQLQNALY